MLKKKTKATYAPIFSNHTSTRLNIPKKKKSKNTLQDDFNFNNTFMLYKRYIFHF